MRRYAAILLTCLTASMLSAGCGKSPTTVTEEEQREKATAQAVEQFKQRLVDLEAEFPALNGVGSFEHSYLGFAFVNNAVEPRVYITVAVEYVSPGSATVASTVDDAQDVEGTPFVTTLHLECSDPVLKQHIEKAYGLLREDLKQIGQ